MCSCGGNGTCKMCQPDWDAFEHCECADCRAGRIGDAARDSWVDTAIKPVVVAISGGGETSERRGKLRLVKGGRK